MNSFISALLVEGKTGNVGFLTRDGSQDALTTDSIGGVIEGGETEKLVT